MADWGNPTQAEAVWGSAPTEWTGSKTQASNDFNNGPFSQDDNVSKHAHDVQAEPRSDVGDPFAGGKDITCRNCNNQGHFSKDCPEPGRNTGGCFNCGQEGHVKAECPNEHVELPFTGTCNTCSEQGHRAAQCPQKPVQPCLNCGKTDHKQAECTAPRDIGNDKVADLSADEAFGMLKLASKERDISDFKTALRVYAKAKPDINYLELEKLFRVNQFTIFLIAMEAEMPQSMTNVDLSGKQDCKYQIAYQFSPKPRRRIFANGWPSSPEENLERLADAGESMHNFAIICHNCEKIGHTSKYCPEDKREVLATKLACYNCGEEGHAMRDCQLPIKSRGGCHNCGSDEHRAAECPEPRSAANVECRKCGEMGHFSKDCPSGGGNACHNCGQEGHRKSECTEPPNPDNMICRNCDAKGHMSRECPEPKDWSRVTCSNCNEKGHGRGRCPQPVVEQDADSGHGGFAGDFGGRTAAPAWTGGASDDAGPAQVSDPAGGDWTGGAQTDAGGSSWGTADAAGGAGGW